jgi:hypothetical protein
MRNAKAWSVVVLPLVVAACGAGSRTSTWTTEPAAPTRAAKTPSNLPEWIQRSNAIAEILLGVQARFLPELASRYGVERVDDQILDLKPGHGERYRAALRDAIATIETRGGAETDPRVRRDVAILIKTARLYIKDSEVREAHEVPYYNPTEIIFNSMQGLLDEQAPPARRERAVARLRRYAGLEGGASIVELAKAETRERISKPGLAAPNRLAVEKHLATNGHLRGGIGDLLRKHQIPGHDEPYKTLVAQLTEYDAFVKNEVLPKARTDFALPEAVYALNLERYGVDIPPAELTERAHRAFAEIQDEMTAVAKAVASSRKLPSADYRDVIKELKKEQLVGDAIRPHYQQRLADVETIIRRENLVTLPDRPARIRLGTPAENAQQPAPHMVPPRLLGNTGEQGEFVLPLSVPPAEGSKESAEKLDDFTFAAASWTLTAHEARPGHEMQFASLIERGVSTARAIYAFNSTNVEGWGLYSEYIMLPFMPPEGKLISLQLRLQRAVRAFIDPELQAGKWTFESAWAYLEKEVGLSRAFAKSEIERFTFRAPGQATSYFYGFSRLLELRRDIEKKLGARFDQKRFHDFVLSQGLLPPDLLREAAMTELMPQAQSR